MATARATADTLYLNVLEHALRGGGRPRKRNRSIRKKATRNRARAPAGGGSPAQTQPAAAEDVDLLTQHFNHTGQLGHVQADAAHLTAHVITPTVRSIIQTQFPHAEGHQLTDLLRKRGHAVPASLEEAKAQLQKFAETAQGVRAGWHQGVYSTVETMVSTTHNPSLIMELFACIATVMDSYSQLSDEDTRLVLPALLTCAAMLQPAAAEHAAARWKAQPYAPKHIQEVDQLRSQIKAIRASQTTAMAGGGATSPVDMSRHLLALNATITQKQQLVETYEKIVAGGPSAAPAVGGGAPPASLSSSILQGSVTPASTTPVAATPAAATPAAATPAAATPAAATPAAATATPAAVAITPTFTPAQAKTTPPPATATALEKKVQQMYLSGGTPRASMKQPTIVGRDLGGRGVHLYAYLHQGKMRLDFQLEELRGPEAQTPQMRKRLEYLAKHRASISEAINGTMDEPAKRQFSIQLAQGTDDRMASAVHKLLA